MRSKDQATQLNSQSIERSQELLAPMIQASYSLSYDINTTHHLPRIPEQWPTLKKGQALSYLGKLQRKNHVFEVFMHEKSFIKDPLNLQVFYTSVENYNNITPISYPDNAPKATQQLTQHDSTSLPIWEEIIHRNKALHKEIVQLAPDYPWTLYKKTKTHLCPSPTNRIGQLGGYPQWYINNMDYRKIKDLEFLMQLSREKEHAYIFMDQNQEIKIWYQSY